MRGGDGTLSDQRGGDDDIDQVRFAFGVNFLDNCHLTRCLRGSTGIIPDFFGRKQPFCDGERKPKESKSVCSKSEEKKKREKCNVNNFCREAISRPRWCVLQPAVSVSARKIAPKSEKCVYRRSSESEWNSILQQQQQQSELLDSRSALGTEDLRYNLT